MEQHEPQQQSPEDCFDPQTAAGRVLIPLLDALNWQGDLNKMLEAIEDEYSQMTLDGLFETLANLNFKYTRVGRARGGIGEGRLLPLLLVDHDKLLIVLSVSEDQALVYNGQTGNYHQQAVRQLNGTMYIFQFAGDDRESLIQTQSNWFLKLLYRFRQSFVQLVVLTLFITLLDLMLPVFISLVYDRILLENDFRPLLYTTFGIVIYIITSLSFNQLRTRLLNFMSNRMGAIISLHTYKRLVFLSPNYTEMASVSSQLSRLKDFENLKKFVTNGYLISVLDLVFSFFYIVAIFLMGGWMGVIPIVTLVLLIVTGLVLRPFYKIKMEKLSQANADRQQSLIEILKNAEDIKLSSSKAHWLNRFNKYTGESIMNGYELSNYVSMTNGISYFISNVSVLVVIYFGVLQVFEGRLTTGLLIGILMLYWKIIGSIRSVFSLSVQINSLLKSITQINRFMKLDQESSLKSSMEVTKAIKGNVRFSEVSIRYTSNSAPALLNVSFSTSPGKLLGISGHDGAGKTTILKLILGMYKPQGGKIFIDNSNIKQLEPLSLRRAIGYCPEKDMILTGTLRDNFKSYQANLTDEAILQLAQRTGLKAYMDLFGLTLDTHMSESMIQSLSLSFKKILNLTRMLSREAKLYLIDEPENHLDREAIDRVMAVVQELALENDVSVIIATKDEQILKKCDSMIQINQGRLVTN